jgi:hypothetical protein
MNDAPVKSMLGDIKFDVVPFAAMARIGISEAPFRIDLGEALFSCFALCGLSCGIASGSISSAITSGTSLKSRNCSSRVSSSCFFSRY